MSSDGDDRRPRSADGDGLGMVFRDPAVFLAWCALFAAVSAIAYGITWALGLGSGWRFPIEVVIALVAGLAAARFMRWARTPR